jgi:cysteine-rich repeat protein
MRTPLIALLIAALVPACMDGLTGVGDDDDTMTGENCGNGAVDTGETCDDGNAAAGDGCSATCQTEAGTMPRLNASADKTNINTELKTTHPITLTLNGVGGFGESVSVAASVVDGADVPLAQWSATLPSPTVDVPMNGMTTAVVTLKVPTVFQGPAAKLKLDITSSLGMQRVTTDIAITNQITFNVKVDTVNGGCIYPSATEGGNQASPLTVTVGTKIRFLNDGTENLEVHTNNANGITHQGQSPNGLADPVTEPNSAYELPLLGPTGGSVNWYCHLPSDDPGIANRPTFNSL